MSGRIGVLAFLSVAVTSVLLGWLGHRQQVALAMEGVDGQLQSVATMVPVVIGQGQMEQILSGKLNSQQQRQIQLRLAEMAQRAQLSHLSINRMEDGKLQRLVGSVPAETSGEDSVTGTDVEAGASQSADKAANNSEMTFGEVSSETEDFRSIQLPGVTAGGDKYVIGAAASLSAIHGLAQEHLLRLAGSGALVAIAVGSVGYLAGRRIARPIVEMSRDIETFTDGDFSNDQQSIDRLNKLVQTESSETGELAYAFLFMRQSLEDHIRDLTRVTAEKERIVGQLEVARHIQRGLLPEQSPSVEGFDIAGWSEAADQTGGDFYDWCPTAAGHLLINLADATGHGIGPAIMASLCRAYARATLCDSVPLAPLVGKLNALVHADTKGAQFVTFFAGVLDAPKRLMTMLSAGHGPSLFFTAQDAQVQSPMVHGPPLGVLDELEPDPDTYLQFSLGDVLLLVSDGFFEWRNKAGEQFGVERLVKELKASADQSAEQIIAHLRQCVLSFTNGTVQPDDMTAVVVKCVV